MDSSSEVDLWRLTDLVTPWAVHTAATLRVAEQIEAGVAEIGALAQAVQADPYALHRLMTYLSQKGVFVEDPPGSFALNGPARLLLDPSVQLGLDLDGIAGRMAHAWTTLLEWTRTGQPAYAARFGLPFWEDLAANPWLAASFDAMIGPQGHGPANPNFTVTGGWKAVEVVMDVGGGTGSLLAELLRAHPHLRGVLVDLPRTVARSSEIFAAAGVTGRAVQVGQSFFDPLPAGADLILLKGILNNWPDDPARTILRNCATAVGQNGRVVVLGGVTPDHSPRPLMIEMVLLGGKHRSLHEMTALAQSAGLELVAAGLQPSGVFTVELSPGLAGGSM